MLNPSYEEMKTLLKIGVKINERVPILLWSSKWQGGQFSTESLSVAEADGV